MLSTIKVLSNYQWWCLKLGEIVKVVTNKPPKPLMPCVRMVLLMPLLTDREWCNNKWELRNAQTGLRIHHGLG